MRQRVNRTRLILLLAGGAALVTCALAITLALRARAPIAEPSAPTAEDPAQVAAAPVVKALAAAFVGRSTCVECHQSQVADWTNSHHDLAMQEPTAQTVRGDFNNSSFTYHDVTTTFFKDGEKYRVRTDGPDGKLHEYPVAYTFGVAPLQQYLIEYSGGRYQALNVCWDTRPAEQGGQRWFHLYPDENVTAQDILHWTGPYQNWNHMCAECHSTNVRKNYDQATDTFNTSWSEIDVSCESCHGPASNHVTWARRNASTRYKEPPPPGTASGFLARLREETPGMWVPDPQTGIAKRDHPRTSHVETQTCARCHSRRGTFSEDVVPGQHPSDTHRLALLEPTLYEADGQIKDEVYEYGSFLQSRMYAAGVSCTDCHNPHTLKTAPGNNACARCHTPEKFDTPQHHFHTPGAKGSSCVDCHMPTRNYMVVHARHDHSLKVPRPDLTVSLGTPNACNTCHQDRTPQWAADEIQKRSPGKPRRPQFAEALAPARRGLPGSDALLARLLADTTQPAIARATAAQMLAGARDPAPLIAALRDPEVLIRAAAVNAIMAPDGPTLTNLIGPLMSDPIRQIRMDAARRLAAAPESILSPSLLAARQRAMDEFVAAQALDADRAEARLTMGALYAEEGDAQAAEVQYRAAMRLSPRFPPAYVNLADLYRQLGREPEAIRTLRDGLALCSDSADIPHALGLALVRTDKLGEALVYLEQASTRAPDVTRYAYVYGVALESAGPKGRGIDVLKQAHERHPADTEVLSALVEYCHDAGKLEEAITYAQRLAALLPGDASAQALLDRLTAQRR